MIVFNSVVLHNFGSFQHTEIDLRNKGFCLVYGENHRKEDNALSNGSGKSMCWSAICFALTGETVQGVKTGLKNIYNDEPDAYVSLDFTADADHYDVKRIIAPHSDLKIEKNGQDVSGKGVRESEAKLASMLPDITADLLTSAILIGQGMPNKFSSFRPSGRKEILEKLTKSDFMIADMKKRIEARKDCLTGKIAEASNKELVAKTKLQGVEARLVELKEKQANAKKPDFDKLLADAENRLAAISKSIDETTESAAGVDERIKDVNKKLIEISNEKLSDRTRLLERYNAATAGLKADKASVETELRLRKSELAKIKSHPDICPTCGQKMPNSEHLKQEKAEKEAAIVKLSEKLSGVNSKLKEKDDANSRYSAQIEGKYSEETTKWKSALSEAQKEATAAKARVNALTRQADMVKDEIRSASARQVSWDKEQADIAESISKLATEGEELKKLQKELSENLTLLGDHLTVVRQLENLTKRDFRGYILSDVINYLDARAKDFSEIIFKHRDLNIYLDGNDLDISYNGKMLDNLSGGERQRVDLITQFAIRDLLINHLNMGSNILVLDEITDFLDKTSCDAVMELVEKELDSVESVFIVSHHAESLGISADSELKIVKDATGVSSVSAC